MVAEQMQGRACLPQPCPACLDPMPVEEASQGSSLAALTHWRSCTGLESKPTGSVRGFVFTLGLEVEVCLLGFHIHAGTKGQRGHFYQVGCRWLLAWGFQGVLNLNLLSFSWSSLVS